ncbi:1,4-alpha-glucan branching enzyme GlgB [Cutibacterium granulosum]|uniref:1,4-alpha-glucan branching enzyme n=3 Tax=Cutibacterium granulosum TaxID=33011 RepID=A0A9X5R455_9ACTN|nr:alpha-amylase family glycosyl hydrolase [Cutibacterium granulosum]ERF65931.1 Family 13 glycosyl hydrolase [Cutibacterium granulosum TM11]KAG9060228.1 alpha amylase C-terminal domain-containing protein [Cutibacterium granulosum DSM 20700]SNV36983.1 1,4-alpha-glucan branching enzyme GlgB [Cutibacterium granulosum]
MTDDARTATGNLRVNANDPIPTDYAERAKGMGVSIINGGAAFRVWAPHAEAVAVTGTFDDWAAQPDGSKDDAQKVQSAPHQLLSEDNGYWYGQVAGAKVGEEYRFVLVNGEQVISRIDPYARHVTSSIGNAIITDPDAYDWEDDDFTAPTLNEMVIYEMHVGTFFDKDPDDDKPATLDTIEEKLDHLVHLGVNAIELMPLMEFAGDYSWGYNPAHIFAVESAYGGPEKLRDLVKVCHRHGLAVIIDVVYNHFGPSDLDLWQFDGWSENGKGGIYFYNDWKSSTPWGDTRPDYGRGEVREFIRDNAMMWLEEFHADGLRYDMTPYMRSVDADEMNIPDGWSLTHWINTEIRERFPRAITIAEDLHGEPKVVSTADDGAAFHAQWDNHFVHPIRAAVIAASDEARNMDAVRDAVEFSYGDAFSRVIYTESHDEVANGSARVPQEVDDGDPTGYYAQKRSTLGAALVLTSPGLPMIFQGQEFLEGEWFRDTVPLHWDQQDEFTGIFRMYSDLVGLRLNKEGRTKGLTGQHVDTLHLNPDTHVYAFHRWADGGAGDDVVVAVNLDSKTWGEYTIGMPAAGRWGTRLNSDAKVYSEAFDGVDVPESFDAVEDDYDGHPASATLVLPPYSVVILSRD